MSSFDVAQLDPESESNGSSFDVAQLDPESESNGSNLNPPLSGEHIYLS